MDEQDALFRLIKSLTKNEKGYFKKYSGLNSTEKTTIYMLLFDAIANQNVYDEKTVKYLLKKQIPVTNFGRVKNYLYQLILKSLSSYHADGSVELQLKKNIHFAEILYNKGLYDLCEKMLNKTEEIARKFGVLEVQIYIYKWRLTIMTKRSFEGINESDIDGIFQKQNILLEQMVKVVNYSHLNTIFSYRVKKTVYIKNKIELEKEFRSIIEHPLLKNESEADSTQTKFLLNNILGLYYYLADNYPTSCIYYDKNFQIFEKYPEQINAKFNHYLSVIYNLIALNILLKEYDKVVFFIEKLEEIKTKNRHYEVRIFSYIHARKLELFLTTFQFEKAILLIPKIEEGLIKYTGQINISDLFGFSFNIAYVYIVMNKYKKAVLWLNKIIAHPVPNISGDVQAFTRILNLIAHYEMEHWDYLPYIIRSTYQFLLKGERLFEFERSLLRFIKKLPKESDDEALKNLMSGFKEEMIVLRSDPDEGMAFRYFDFISWIESKIEKRPFQDIMKEKAGLIR